MASATNDQANIGYEPVFWNDSEFSSCEESVTRYKAVYIEPLNRHSYSQPPLQRLPVAESPLAKNLSNSSMSAKNIDYSLNLTSAEGDESLRVLVDQRLDDYMSNPLEALANDGALKHVARIVCLFGIAGNLLNLYVLTRRRMRRSMMDHMEKCAQLGLLALAICEAFLCLTHFAHSIAVASSLHVIAYTSDWQLVSLFLDVYGEALLNWLCLTGTYLTVVVAVGRFLVVCRPLHARGLISVRGTKLALVGAWLLALVCNLPRFFHYEAVSYPFCTQACPCYIRMREVGWLYVNHKTFIMVYKFIYFGIGVAAPLLLLVACNACLIAALRRSRELQEACVADGSDANRRRNRLSSRNRITPTLICLVAAFILLVGPSEVITFLRDEQPAVVGFPGFRLAVELTNLFQLINYAANFILYCMVNADFRKICFDIFCCTRFRRRGGSSGRSADGVSDLEQTDHKIFNMKKLLHWRSSAGRSDRDGSSRIDDRGGTRKGRLNLPRTSQTMSTTCGHYSGGGGLTASAAETGTI